MKPTLKILLICFFSLWLSSCSSDNNTQKEKTTEQQPIPTPTEQSNPSKEILIDTTVTKDSYLSDLAEKKITLQFNGRFIIGYPYESLIFKDGEIAPSGKMPSSGFYCSLSIRTGKEITNNDTALVTYKTQSGSGYGGSGYTHYQSYIEFLPPESTVLKSIYCSYIGEDILFSPQIQDLQKAFGSWISVIVYKETAK